MTFNRLKISVFSLIFLLFHSILVTPFYGFSIGEERELGEKLLYSVRSAFPVLDDPDISRYVTELGEEVLDVAGLQYFNYHFFVINSGEFNAFAAPSGLVFFYSGLIGAMNSEEELLSVLAHEIGHVAKRHIAGRMEKGKLIGAASVAAALAAIALGGGAASQALLTGSLAANQSATLHFSRKDEEEADQMAYMWMTELGRDTKGQEAMLKTMRRISRYRSEKLPQYLLTHPNPEARLDYVQGLIAAEPEDIDGRTKEQFDFLRFKYRVMSLTTDSSILRVQLAQVISNQWASDVDRSMAAYGLSQVEMQENNYKRSLEHLDRVRKDFPDQSILLTDQGVVLFNAGKFREAIAVLEKSRNLDNRDNYAAMYLAKSYQAIGRTDKAQSIYTSIAYELPEYSKVYFEQGKIASQNKQSDLAALYLGKYYLYEGKLKLAKFSLKNVMREKSASKKNKQEAEELLTKIEKLLEK